MNLEDSKWPEFNGGYKIQYDASKPLKKLQSANEPELQYLIFSELWDNLHHQGDVGLASYYSVPHVISICIDKNSLDWNFIGLVVLIEACRPDNSNPTIPEDFEIEYLSSLKKFEGYLLENFKNINEANAVRLTLAFFAIGKSQLKLGRLIHLSDESVIDEFLARY